jgi:hypothetical protein
MNSIVGKTFVLSKVVNETQVKRSVKILKENQKEGLYEVEDIGTGNRFTALKKVYDELFVVKHKAVINRDRKYKGDSMDKRYIK